MIEKFNAAISFSRTITKRSLAYISKKLHFATGMPCKIAHQHPRINP